MLSRTIRCTAISLVLLFSLTLPAAALHATPRSPAGVAVRVGFTGWLGELVAWWAALEGGCGGMKVTPPPPPP